MWNRSRGLLLALPFAMAPFAAQAAEVERSVEVQASPDEVWRAVGGFCSIQEWHPAIDACELEEKAGTTYRHLKTVDGAAFEEQLMGVDEDARVYEYTILESPLPVLSYLATLSVTPGTDEDKALVTWQSRFSSLGVEDEEAEQIIAGIYEAGLDGIAASFK